MSGELSALMLSSGCMSGFFCLLDVKIPGLKYSCRPPYLPYLALSDFCLFPKLKGYLR